MTDPRVFLVGAGPGHSGLLTLRAAECLRQADLVLYDRLVAPALLDHAPPGAERLCVTELAGSHPERVPEVHQALIAAASSRRYRRNVKHRQGPFQRLPAASLPIDPPLCQARPVPRRSPEFGGARGERR